MTFTGGFDLSSVNGLELVFDERADAERVASAYRTEHYEMVMHAGDMAWVLPELVWHLEDLRAGMSYPNHYIARLASKFVKVSLAGTGGDELFAGYPWRYDLVEGLDDPEEFDRRYYDVLVPARSRGPARQLLHRERAGGLHGRRRSTTTAPRIEPARSLDPVSKALYFEAKTFLHGLLVVEDRVSMAHSLEVRVPFLDNELVEIARRIPSHLKHSNGGGKRLLRRAMRGLLSEEILEKRKQGFSPPDESWYRGPSMAQIADAAARPADARPGVLRADVRQGRARRAPRRAGEPPSPDLVAALLRVVEPPLHRRRAEDAPQRLARRDRAVRRVVRRLLHAAAIAVTLVLFVPFGLVGRVRTARRRRRGERPVIVRGPVPIVSIHYAARADRLRGYRSETIVYGTYRISARGLFDHDLSRWRRIPLFGQLVPYAAFLWALTRYDLFVFFFDGGLLGETPAWRLEPRLLHLAGKRIVVVPVRRRRAAGVADARDPRLARVQRHRARRRGSRRGGRRGAARRDRPRRGRRARLGRPRRGPAAARRALPVSDRRRRVAPGAARRTATSSGSCTRRTIRTTRERATSRRRSRGYEPRASPSSSCSCRASRATRPAGSTSRLTSWSTSS